MLLVVLVGWWLEEHRMGVVAGGPMRIGGGLKAPGWSSVELELRLPGNWPKSVALETMRKSVLIP